MADLITPPADSAASDPSVEPTTPELNKHRKPVLHIGTEGERLEQDDLEIDDEQLPVFGSDNLHT
jgi:hypothetical protein